MDERLMEAMERIEIAFKASKPFIQLQDALVLYKVIQELPPYVLVAPPLVPVAPPLVSQSEKHTGQN